MDGSLDFRTGRKRGVQRFTHAEHARHYRLRHPERQTENRKRYKRAHPIRQLLAAARLRAKQAGLEFNIREEDLLPLPSHCPVLGILLIYGSGKGRQHGCASLDRIDNSEGYVKGNVAVMSLRANELKRDGTLTEFEAIARWLTTQTKKDRLPPTMALVA